MTTDEASHSNPSDVEEEEEEGTLEDAKRYMDQGLNMMKCNDFDAAADMLSRALQIMAGHYGELAPECSRSYYLYGRALLYKAQEETDPLGTMPKKESAIVRDSEQGSVTKGESSAASGVTDAKEDGHSNQSEETKEGARDKAQVEDEDEGSEDEVDEDESDLDLAWKMLDVARVIVEKMPGDTMEKVDILSTLGEAALEREDIQASLSDYTAALAMLERLVEPDSRQIVELSFRICLVLEVDSRPEEAIPYCQKAISVCKARIQHLNEMKNALGPASATNADEPTIGIQADTSELDTLTGVAKDLENKLEDLKQFVLQPKSIISEVLKRVSAAKATGEEQKTAISTTLSSSRMGAFESTGGFDSPTVSTAHTNGNAPVVTHLGVVGRGVKRMVVESSSVESSSSKKLNSSVDKGQGSSS